MSGNDKEGFRGTPVSDGATTDGTGQKGSAARPSKRSPGRLSRSDQHRIGNLLQRTYDDVLNEGVPDRFKLLLEKLEPGGSGGSGSRDGSPPDQQTSPPMSATSNPQNRESTE